jgi:TRAP-type C4-dicarboxylate transport system permease small subunit
MTEMRTQPELLRIVSAVLLGCIVGAIFFLIFALGIGAINDNLHMNIPVNLLVAENIMSAAMLAIFIIICVAIFLRMVWNTPPSVTEQDE